MQQFSYTLEYQAMHNEEMVWVTNNKRFRLSLLPDVPLMSGEFKERLKTRRIIGLSRFTRSFFSVFNTVDNMYVCCQQFSDLSFAFDVWALLTGAHVYQYKKHSDYYDMYSSEINFTQLHSVILVREEDIDVDTLKTMVSDIEDRFNYGICKIVVLGKHFSQFSHYHLDEKFNIYNLKSVIEANVDVDASKYRKVIDFDIAHKDYDETFKKKYIRSLIFKVEQEDKVKEELARIEEERRIRDEKEQEQNKKQEDERLKIQGIRFEVKITPDKIISNKYIHMVLSDNVIKSVKDIIMNDTVIDVFGGTGVLWNNDMVYNDVDVRSAYLAHVNYARLGYDILCLSKDYKDLTGYYDYVFVDPPWSMYQNGNEELLQVVSKLGRIIIYTVPVSVKCNKGILICSTSSMRVYMFESSCLNRDRYRGMPRVNKQDLPNGIFCGQICFNSLITRKYFPDGYFFRDKYIQINMFEHVFNIMAYNGDVNNPELYSLQMLPFIISKKKRKRFKDIIFKDGGDEYFEYNGILYAVPKGSNEFKILKELLSKQSSVKIFGVF